MLKYFASQDLSSLLNQCFYDLGLVVGANCLELKLDLAILKNEFGLQDEVVGVRAEVRNTVFGVSRLSFAEQEAENLLVAYADVGDGQWFLDDSD